MPEHNVPEERPRGLAGEHLEEALNYLQATGDPPRLYGTQHPTPADATAEAILTAFAYERRRKHARNGVLFAAFAAEAYINEFTAALLSGKNQKALDRVSPVDRYILATGYIDSAKPLFRRDDGIIPVLADLFVLRNKLVHPKPGYGPRRFQEEATDFDSTFNAAKLVRFVIIVAAAARVLVTKAYGKDALDYPAAFIWSGSRVLLDYVERTSDLPRFDAPAERPLISQILDGRKP